MHGSCQFCYYILFIFICIFNLFGTITFCRTFLIVNELFQCDLTTSRSEQERLQLERFELLSTANELRQQLRQVREGTSAKARSLEASPVCGMFYNS